MSHTVSKRSAKVIAISSGKGGVGKSNIALNLSISFADSGQNVCLFDADINLANINILLGINPQYTLQQLFTENKSVNDILTRGPAGIDIVAGASGVAEFTRLSSNQQQRLLKAIRQLEKDYDYLIIDTAAGADDSVLSFLHAVPYLIMIITKEPTSLTDAFSLLKILSKQGYKQTVLVIVNMVADLKMAKHIFTRFEFAVKKYLKINVQLLGYIAYDIKVLSAVENQQALIKYAPNSPASQCIENIAQRLHKALGKMTESNLMLVNFFEKQLKDDVTKQYQQQALPQPDLLTQINNLSDSQAYTLFQQLQSRFPLPLFLSEKEGEYEKESENEKNQEKINTYNAGLKQALFYAARIN